MGTKQENKITVKIKCEINELCTILEKKGFYVVNKFTLNDIFMIPNYMKKEIDNLTSREILKKQF
ncbi:MAG: type II toxin-antitoxin system HicA family toxin [Clostridia bacterium]|nr:type II toxin-antitoxin system HicA family toxin [Clostridia bacterium]